MVSHPCIADPIKLKYSMIYSCQIIRKAINMKCILLFMTLILASCGPVTPEQCEEDCFECDLDGTNCVTTLDCICQCDAKCRNGY